MMANHGSEPQLVSICCVYRPGVFDVGHLDGSTVFPEPTGHPAHPLASNKSIIQKYSDHNALLVKINITYQDARRETKTQAIEGWKLTEEGLSDFSEATSGPETKYLANVTDYNMLEQELSNIMDACFQKKRKQKKVNAEEYRITEGRFKTVLNILIPFWLLNIVKWMKMKSQHNL